MTIRFRETVADHGLDISVNPAWQMVPVGGSRTLTLTGASGLMPRVRDPQVLVAVTVPAPRGAPWMLILTGVREGLTSVEWVASVDFAGPVQQGFTLHVSVKRQQIVNTAFHYVSDGRRQITRRRIGDIDALVAGVNAILTPQANVRMVKKSAAPLNIAQNLGRVVRFSSDIRGVAAAQHEWDDVTASADRTADFNVFFVREYEQDRSPLHDDAEAGTIAADKSCIFEDRTVQPAAETLAHETVHLLGVAGHSRLRGNLMSRRGAHLTKAQINQINTSGT